MEVSRGLRRTSNRLQPRPLSTDATRQAARDSAELSPLNDVVNGKVMLEP